MKIEVLRKRMEKLLKDAKLHGLTKEQKHLDKGVPERAYWHYGYGMALRDVLKNFQLVVINKN